MTTSQAKARSARLPAFAVCLMLFLVTDAFSGHRLGIPLPIGLDRVVFATFLLLILLDPRIRWRTWRIRPTAWIALAALGWASASAYEHDTLTSSMGFFALLDRLAVPSLIFALGPVALASRRSRIVLLQVLCGLGLYLGFTAICEVVGPHALVFPRYIANPNVGILYGRARGPFLSSDADATVMATCMFGSFALRAVTLSQTWRRLANLSALLCLAGVFLGLTRAEWIGTSVALIVAGMLVPSMRKKLPFALGGIAVAIALALTVSPSLQQTVVNRLTTVSSVDDRDNTNAAGVRALGEHPLFGIGWDEFLNESSHFVRQARDYPLTHTDIEIHNVPLARLTELGLLGGGLWIVSVVLGPVAAMFARRRRDLLDEAYRVAFVGTAIVWLVAIQFSPFPYPLPNALVWLLAGVVLAPLGVANSSPRLARSAGPDRPIGEARAVGAHRPRPSRALPPGRPRPTGSPAGNPPSALTSGLLDGHIRTTGGSTPLADFALTPADAQPAAARERPDPVAAEPSRPLVMTDHAKLLPASPTFGAAPDGKSADTVFDGLPRTDSAVNLRAVATRGAALTTLQMTSARLLGLLGFVVLARFLSPADYGTAALATVFVALFSAITAGGLGQALVQREAIDRAYVDTTFWFAVTTGLVLTGTLAAGAFPLARALGQPRLGPVLLVLSVNFLVIGLTSVQMALMRRAFRFAVITRISIVSNLIATIAGIVLAVTHFGVWALVVQTVVQPALASLLLWRASSYRPRMSIQRSYVRPIYRVSSQFLGQIIADFLSQRTDDFLVGSQLGAAALGVYSVAYRLLSVMMDILANSLRQAALPVFSRLQSRREQLRRSYSAVIGLSALVVMPCFAFIFAAAPQVILVVFGSKWHAAIPLVRVFAVYGALEGVMVVNQVFLQGAGAVRTAFRLAAAGTVLQVVGFIIAFRFGLAWVASAYVVRSYLIAPIGLRRAAELVGTTTRQSLARVGKPFLCSAIMAGVVFLVGREIGPWPVSLQLAATFAVGLVVYSALACTMMRHHVADLRLMTSSLRRRQAPIAEAVSL